MHTTCCSYFTFNTYIYPIQTFQNKSIQEIGTTLRGIFPKDAANPFTDYNAFFEHCALTVKSKDLVLRTDFGRDGQRRHPGCQEAGQDGFSQLILAPIEKLARGVTVRLLYTDAVTGKNWQTKVKRRRVKMWTQDA